MPKYDVTVTFTQRTHITIETASVDDAEKIGWQKWHEEEGGWTEPSYIEVTEVSARLTDC